MISEAFVENLFSNLLRNFIYSLFEHELHRKFGISKAFNHRWRLRNQVRADKAGNSIAVARKSIRARFKDQTTLLEKIFTTFTLKMLKEHLLPFLSCEVRFMNFKFQPRLMAKVMIPAKAE